MAGLAAAAAAAAGDFEAGGLAGPGLVGGFDAIAPGDVAATIAGEFEGDVADAVAGEGEVAGGGLAAFAEATAPGEAAAPCGAGLAPPVGEGLSSSFGARAPMFARSWPMRIFPSETGRSKM
jgi:hypothetical protein